MTDDKPRRPRGRPPGSKNKSTLEKERLERERMISETKDEIVEQVVKTMKDEGYRVVKDRGIRLKNHRGTFRVVKRQGEYVMLESEQYGNRAYNVILKGDRIVADKVDGMTDPRARLMFKSDARVRKESAERVLDMIQDCYDGMDRICDALADIEGTGLDDVYRDFVIAMEKVETVRDDLMDWISSGTVKSKKSSKGSRKSRTVKFSINGNAVYPETEDNIRETIRRYIDDDEGLKEYYADRYTFGDDPSNPDAVDFNKVRDTLLDCATTEIMHEVDYHMNQGEELEYPEFGITFYPDVPDGDVEESAKSKKGSAKPARKGSPKKPASVPARKPSVIDMDIEDMIKAKRVGKDVTGVDPDPDEPIPTPEPPSVGSGEKPDTDPDMPIPDEELPAVTPPGDEEGNDIEALESEEGPQLTVPPEMAELGIDLEDIDLEEESADEIEKMIEAKRKPLEIPTVGGTQPFANNYRTVSMGQGKDLPTKRI